MRVLKKNDQVILKLRFFFCQNIGTAPVKVIDFKCRSYNWENLTCSFERPYNPVPVNYTLYYGIGIGKPIFKTSVSIFTCCLVVDFSRIFNIQWKIYKFWYKNTFNLNVLLWITVNLFTQIFFVVLCRQVRVYWNQIIIENSHVKLHLEMNHHIDNLTNTTFSD